jgi:hypothetical protein
MTGYRGAATVLLVICLAGCGATSRDISLDRRIPDDVRIPLETEKEFELFALSPLSCPMCPYSATPIDDGFHGYHVLGQTRVTDASQRSRLLSALNQGVQEATVTAKCFEPRHGLRVIHEGKTIDLIIAFGCGYALAYVDDQRVPSFDSSQSPEAVFDEALRAAGVPLSPTRP